MSNLTVTATFPLILNLAGTGLSGGKVYIGLANSDPQTTPQVVYWDVAGTTVAAQPLATIGGYIVRNGSPALVFVPLAYSMRVLDSAGNLVYYLPDSAALGVGAGGGGIVSIARDGSAGPTAAIPWGGYNLTGVGAFTAVSAAISGAITAVSAAVTTFAASGVATLGQLITGKATINGAAFTTPTVVTVAATTTINFALSNVFLAPMTTNITTLTLANANAGQTINVRFTQDATGSRTIVWPSSLKWGGSAPALSTAAGSVDLLVLTYFADTGTYLASLAKNFA